MLGGNAQASDGDIRTQPVGYRGVLSLSQGEHEDTVKDRENRQHKCGSRRYYVRMVVVALVYAEEESMNLSSRHER